MEHGEIIGRYGDLCRVVYLTPTSETVRWVNVCDIPPDVVGEFVNCGGPAFVDIGTSPDLLAEALDPEYMAHPIRRVIQHPAFLPTFGDVAHASMLQSQIQPVSVVSVDRNKKTAMVLLGSSTDARSMSWKDVMTLNPQLLAQFLVDTSVQ